MSIPSKFIKYTLWILFHIFTSYNGFFIIGNILYENGFYH